MLLATRQELQDLTGYRRPSSIAAHLQRLGVRYVLGGDGWPRVASAALERMLDPPKGGKAPEVDVAALREAMRVES